MKPLWTIFLVTNIYRLGLFITERLKEVWSDDIIEASNPQHLKESTYLINENNYKIVVVVVDVNRRRLSNQNFEFLQFHKFELESSEKRTQI